MVLPKTQNKTASEPTQSGSGGERQAVTFTAGEDVARRLARQNKAIARVMADPANAEGPAGKNWSKRVQPLPMKPSGTHSAAWYEQADDDEHHILRRLEGEKTHGDKWTHGDAAAEVRGLNWEDLFRAYKHTPHQPAAVYLKYLVHRLTHMDDYEDPVRSIGLDIEFLKHHQKGGAADKNGHLVPRDFHDWMHIHPDLPEQLLAHKAKLHAELARGVGLNIRDINGEKYVALTRGLNSDIMDHEHALSSWSDLVDSGFGKYMNHAWVPLKDLWYSYQFGPEMVSGAHGHENEYLLSNTLPRYEAEPHDVKSVRGHGDLRFYDTATDDELAKFAARDPALLSLSGAGPKTLEQVQKSFDPSTIETYALPTKFRTREQALASPLPISVKNPNLSRDDLHAKILQLSAANTLDPTAAHLALSHPNATADTARSLLSQYAPGREYILEEVAQSPLAPPDALDRIVESAPDSSPLAVSYVLLNPNHTSTQADTIARLNVEKGRYSPDWSIYGRYSPQLIKEMSDQVEQGYGQEPHHSKYPHGAEDEAYKADLDKFLKAKARFANTYNGLVKMGGNKHLDDDATEALLEAIQRHKLAGGLSMITGRQHEAPMSEVSQLRLLRALDSGIISGGVTIGALAKSRGLAPTVVQALALHPDFDVRRTLYQNRTVDPEVLAQAWNDKLGTPEGYLPQDSELESPYHRDPYYHLAQAIIDRRAYAARRAANHLIRPWPKELAKSEMNWWPLTLREWMSKRSKGVPGYYVRVPTLDQARAMVENKTIPVEPTDEVLDGYVVMAYPADDYNYHSWEKDPKGGDALVYFETDSPPLRHEGRVYWPHEVVTSDARLAGIRPTNVLVKGEPISRGPAFNGEKDRPDEAGDPQFPFRGGSHKESTEVAGLKLPGADLEPGEHATALAQLGYNSRFELVLAAACFLARKPFDQEKFQQGLAVYGDEARAALHAVDLADSEKNLRALGAIIMLQGGKARALSKSEEPRPIGIYSIQPGNEDAVDAADSVERAVRSGTVIALRLRGKHSAGAMAARDPRSGRVWLLKPGSGKQSPAAGVRDGTASQSRREAAYWHVADEVHLGGVVPRADLLMVNAQEWAAIKLLGRDWRSLDERNRERQDKGREVLGAYLANGQLHRWAILDWVLGNVDSHGQNMLVSEGGSVALIDHGSAFAGPGFDPAHDTKSFIPFYLRVWAPESDFKRKTPEERVKYMPVLSQYEDDVLKRWLIEDFTPEVVERELRKYGIDEKVVQAVLARLIELRSAPGNLSRTIDALWAGTQTPKAGP